MSDILSDATTSVGGEEIDTEPNDTVHEVSVHDGSEWHHFEAEHGRTLRAALQEHGLSPHGSLTRQLNCGGRGHCAACTVEVEEGGEKPDQWLDAFLDGQGSGRLSCQIDVTQDMTVRV